MSNDQTLPSQRPAAGGLQSSGSPRSPQPARQNLAQATVTQATVSAPPRRWYWAWGQGAGLLVLLSLGLHGLLLAVPLPQTAPPEIAEDPADEDADLEATIAITSLPPPTLDEPLPVEPPIPAPAPPAPAAPAPTAIAPPPQTAPAEPAPAPAAEPVPAPEAAPENASETAAFTPAPAAEPPADAAPGNIPGNILGVPLLPGSQPLASPADGLKGDRLALHLRNGSPHPDLEGQFLVPATDKDPEAWFARVYRPVLSEAYNVRNEGAFAGAPKYSLTRDSYERFAFITVEWVADRNQMLVTVWRRNPT